MPDPLHTTFRVLKVTRNLHAVDVLLAGLETSDDRIRSRSATTLLRRNSARGHAEVIRRLNQLGDDVDEEVRQQVHRLRPAVKQSLLCDDGPLRLKALELVRQTEDFDQVPVLLELLRGQNGDLHQPTVEVLREVLTRLYEDCFGDRGHQAPSRHLAQPHQVREMVLVALEQACDDIEAHRYPEEIVEWVLVLGSAGTRAVKKVLSQDAPRCRELAERLMMTSTHPGVMQLPLEWMSTDFPLPQAFEAIRRRGDAEFVNHLLRWFPRRLSPVQAKNFRQLESVAWLETPAAGLEAVSPGLQESLVSFVSSTSLPDATKLQVQEWLVRHGTPQGRLAASEVLAALDDESVQRIVCESLDAEDADVQAWATSQLRAQGVPEAFRLLVERLNSPLEAVREAAREELEDFNLERMLELFEHLDPETCRRAGRLLLKIHPECVEELSRELSDAVRRKRIRAAHAAKALGFCERVVPALVPLLEDEDSGIRRAGAEALGGIAQAECIEALTRLLKDRSPRVVEAAQASLEETRRAAAQAPQSVSQAEVAGPQRANV